MRALWGRWWALTGRVSDWGVWVLVMGLLIFTALVLFAGAYRIAEGSPWLDRGPDVGDQKVTDQTVAPAVTYQPEVVAP